MEPRQRKRVKGRSSLRRCRGGVSPCAGLGGSPGATKRINPKGKEKARVSEQATKSARAQNGRLRTAGKERPLLPQPCTRITAARTASRLVRTAFFCLHKEKSRRRSVSGSFVRFLGTMRSCRFHRRMLRILPGNSGFGGETGDAGLPPRPAQGLTPPLHPRKGFHPLTHFRFAFPWRWSYFSTALMRRTPAEEDSSFMILNSPRSPVLVAWGPPQISKEYSPIL